MSKDPFTAGILADQGVNEQAFNAIQDGDIELAEKPDFNFDQFTMFTGALRKISPKAAIQHSIFYMNAVSVDWSV